MQVKPETLPFRSRSTRRFTLNNVIIQADLSIASSIHVPAQKRFAFSFRFWFPRTKLLYENKKMVLTCLLLVMSDVNRDLVSGTAGARRVHVRGETIVASAQQERGNRQAGTHACAGGWRNKERKRKTGREERERNKKRKRDTDVWIILQPTTRAVLSRRAY